jgi:lysophospholipase L1-like esterase
MYWAARGNPKLEFRNFGVDREETEQIAVRLEEAAEGADVVVVQGGINDVVHGKSIEQGADNLRSIVNRGRALGRRVLLTNVLPCNGFPEAEQSIRALNHLIEEISHEERVTLLPFYDTLEDPDRPGRIGPTWTDDGNHPSIAGHRRLGELAFSLPSDPGE